MINITVKELRFIMSIVVDNVISFNFQFISTGLGYDELHYGLVDQKCRGNRKIIASIKIAIFYPGDLKKCWFICMADLT